MPHPVLDTLLAAERVVLTTHVRPDGDALGSEIALALFLRTLGKRVTMLNADAPPRNLEWLLDFAEPTVYTGALKQLKALDEADAIVVLDTGTEHRIGEKLGPLVRQSPVPKLLIDHHPGPDGWFDHQLLRTDAAATGEILYDLIAEHDADLIDAGIATALYAAIMTDTGSFRYGATTSRTHQIVADLFERGDISPEPIHVALFDTRRMSGLRLLGRMLETVTPVYDGQIAYAVVSVAMLQSSDARSEEAEGFVSYPLSLEGVRAVVLFLETTKGVKCSFRSKGDLAINGWARAFGGGGHRNAAGAFVRKPLKEVIDAVIGAAPKHLGLGE
ncbi:MAG: bifunctional oligoribonuclease/PAP phosphatase NrnA, partial [Rhodothermales bacterium]|nr:bifunctional oligoribonuclease/PAP phosphatase NrnA [Rhodothermales bacterium]